MKASTSIFSRQFKRTFNQNKYQNLVAARNPDLLSIGHDSYTHMGFISPQGFKVSRFGVYLTMLIGTTTVYLNPGYFHELVLI
jgi:hypothetical protein